MARARPSTGTTKSGKQLWKERLGGDHCASPIDNRGKIFFFSQNGQSTVIEVGPKFKILAENQLNEGLYACPAVSGDVAYLRTENRCTASKTSGIP
jgi:outer membrane protein assembly factor BamB